MRRPPGVYVLVVLTTLGCGITALFGLGRVYPEIDDPAAAAVPRPSYVSGVEPIERALAGLPPEASDINPLPPSPDIRTVVVVPGAIELRAGGQTQREIPFPAAAPNIADVAAAVADPAWIEHVGDTVALHAGLLLQPRTMLDVTAPVRTVVMDVRPGVYIGASGATLSLRGVTVQAADANVPPVGEHGDPGRPFVVASDLARMDITDSTLRYLGRDWNTSLGVSWVRGSTGSVVRSTFEHNFVGAFAYNARDLTVERSTFRENAMHGLSITNASTGVLVDNSKAERNGQHGIILSDHVSSARLLYNLVTDNGINGIMLNYASDQSELTGNWSARNRGDGIYLADSSENVLNGNVVDKNRIGLRQAGLLLRPNRFDRNTVSDNVVATQGIDGLPSSNVLVDNGQHWRPVVAALISAGTVVLAVALCLLTWWVRRRRNRAVPQVVRTVGPATVGAQ